MNQPRCVLLAAFALTALLVGSAIAQSTIDVSLNLNYTDPNTEAAGGTFTLVAKTDDAIGIAAVNSYLTGIEASSVTLQSGIGAITPNVMTFPSAAVNVLYGQDISTAVVTGVGLAGSAGDVGSDPLANSAWNNATAIFTGNFGAVRPAFVTEGSNSTAGNVLTSTTAPGSAAAATMGTITVRGDGVTSDGLAKGDVNRSWNVDGNDLSLMLASFNQPGGWNNGDFDSSGLIDGNDLSALLANFNTAQTPPALSGAAIPEPASVLLLTVAGLLLFGWNRRSQRS